jgi:biopolymer transport protein TolR
LPEIGPLPQFELWEHSVCFRRQILLARAKEKKEKSKMSMMSGTQGRVSSEINVTPMIDVMLVLLIIFMVIFPHQSIGELADVPQQSTATTVPPPYKPIVIQIQEGSERPGLQINQEKVSWENLGARLETIYSLRADKVAFLKGDPEIDFQYVAEAIDIAHHAGVVRVGLMGRE